MVFNLNYVFFSGIFLELRGIQRKENLIFYFTTDVL